LTATRRGGDGCAPPPVYDDLTGRRHTATERFDDEAAASDKTRPLSAPDRRLEDVISWAIRQVVVWGIVAVLLYSVVGTRLTELMRPPDPGVPVTAAPPPPVMEEPPSLSASVAAKPQPVGTQFNGERPVRALAFHAKRDGHVWLRAFVNNAPVIFIVDTGATHVALSLRDAQAAGLDNGRLVYRGFSSTANGLVRVAPVRLRELRIGEFTTTDVEAEVLDNLGVSLLGQSFLNRLDSYEMHDGVLTFTWN
jgi:clan AA aspartic protease (TIGR02281 family)